MAKEKIIAAVKDLTVYAGYHGDTSGKWDHDFDAAEIAETEKIKVVFRKTNPKTETY